MVVQLELTRRQERYAQRCVGIARFVYNRMVANDQCHLPLRWRGFLNELFACFPLGRSNSSRGSNLRIAGVRD